MLLSKRTPRRSTTSPSVMIHASCGPTRLGKDGQLDALLRLPVDQHAEFGFDLLHEHQCERGLSVRTSRSGTPSPFCHIQSPTNTAKSSSGSTPKMERDAPAASSISSAPRWRRRWTSAAASRLLTKRASTAAHRYACRCSTQTRHNYTTNLGTVRKSAHLHAAVHMR